jgi:serine/threonine-protein kinase RsbW/stage II sporulation protein AB (anti-sigma F factor)
VPALSERLDLRVAATDLAAAQLRHAARRFAEQHLVADAEGLELAVSEAATNAILHAYRDGPAGEIRLVMCPEPDRIVVVVRDWGAGMLPRPDSPGLGLGLPTMATLAELFAVEVPDNGGTLVRMHFPTRAANAA